MTLGSQCESPSPPPLPATPTGPFVKIALLAPAAGEMEIFGRLMRNGILLSFDEWNQQGGLLHHQIAWNLYDTNCDFETARQAAQQAIEDGFKFLIGPLCSEAAIAAAEVAQRADVVMLSPTAAHPLVTRDGEGQTRPNIFRISHTYAEQGRAMARFATENLLQDKVAIFTYPSDDYTRLLTHSFAEQFIMQGGTIVYQTHYDRETDFQSLIQAAIEAEANLIYFPAPTDTQLITQLHFPSRSELSADIIFLGSDSWRSEFVTRDIFSGSYFPLHFSAVDPRSRTQEWIDLYQATYAIKPEPLAVLGYDTAQILGNAIQQAGSFDPQAVIKSLEQNSFAGVTGPITFNVDHNPRKPIPIMKIQAEGIIFSSFALPQSSNPERSRE